MKLFSIFDKSAQAFNRPFFSTTRATAMRDITMGLKGDSAMTIYSQDFELAEVGEFDITSGVLTPEPGGPNMVCAVKDLLPIEEEPDAEDTSERLS